MLLHRLAPWCCFLCLGLPLPAGGADPKPSPEMRWAKQIAADFWDAILAGEHESAAGLLSPELSRGMGERFADKVDHAARNFDISCLSFVAEEFAPDGSEAVFKGKLDKKGLFGYDFMLRLAREGGSGRWSIRYFRLKFRGEGDGKPAGPDQR
jgi:hypothetical protein